MRARVGEVVQFIRIIHRMVQFLGWAAHVAFHQTIGMRIGPSLTHPCGPVGIVQYGLAFAAHQVLLDVQLIRAQVANVMKRAIAHAADWIRRPLGQVVVYAVDILSMRLRLALQHRKKTGAVIIVFARIPAGGRKKRRQNIRILHQSIRALPHRCAPRPTRHQSSVQARVPVGPFAAGKL